MAYIYKITNDINQKIYIGKTERDIEIRFKEHCKNYNRINYEKRPLYAAMRKYGIEHFHIELVEETDNPEERETYWIEYFGSFKNGYNATVGGDGKKYLDYDLIVSTYKQLNNAKETAKLLNISEDSVRTALKNKNIDAKHRGEFAKENSSIPVAMYDKEENLLKTFASYNEAANWLIENKLTNCKLSTIRTHISEVCNNKRKTTCNYIWKKI